MRGVRARFPAHSTESFPCSLVNFTLNLRTIKIHSLRRFTTRLNFHVDGKARRVGRTARLRYVAMRVVNFGIDNSAGL